MRLRGMMTAASLIMLVSSLAGGREPRTLEEVARILEAAAEHKRIDVFSIGKSAGGREIPAVHIGSRGAEATWKVLLIGRQHGNEPAGGEALVELIDRVARSEVRIPQGTAVWVVPTANPDGAAAGERRNAAAADLNRDHLLLEQPETRALHALARGIRPHVVVDCHEFTRDSDDYLERGWGEWPLITMDTANHPLLPAAIYEIGLDWIERASRRMTDAGFDYRRYLVGGVPPEHEMRPSTLDGDDARNGLALDGSLGFIIESGIRRRAENPNVDLDERVDAYLELLDFMLTDTELRQSSLTAVDQARTAPAPDFMPTNVFWADCGLEKNRIRVVDLESGRTKQVAAPNLMLDRVVKRSVAVPAGYVVDAAAATRVRQLLERHDLAFEVLREDTVLEVEPVRLVRVEEAWDPVYGRYGGRQVTETLLATEIEYAAGSLVVRLDGPQQWRRTVALLEPSLLYGLYQYPEHRASVSPQGVVPVARIAKR